MCPECGDTGRIRIMRTVGGRSHLFVQPCPYCPPSNTVNEAMRNAEERDRREAEKAT
jgi:hypothetical protein